MLYHCRTGTEASIGITELNENGWTKDDYAEVVPPD